MKYVRPMDLHDRFYKCERDGCVEVVERRAHEALVSRLAECDQLLRESWEEYPWGCSPGVTEAIQSYLAKYPEEAEGEATP